MIRPKMIQTSAAWPPCQKPIWACHMKLDFGLDPWVAFCSNRISIWKRFILVSVVVGNPNILQHITAYSNIFQSQQVVDTQKPHQVGSKNRVLIGKHRSMVTMFARCSLQSPLVLCGRPPCSELVVESAIQRSRDDQPSKGTSKVQGKYA